MQADGVGKGNENSTRAGRSGAGVDEAVHGIQRESVSLEEANGSRPRGNTISDHGGPVSLDAKSVFWWMKMASLFQTAHCIIGSGVHLWIMATHSGLIHASTSADQGEPSFHAT